MPGYCFFFGGYETSRYFLTPEGSSKSDLGPLHTVACGAVGGVCLWTAVFPADVIKSRVQVFRSSEQKPSFVGIFREIYNSEGAKGLYRGLGPTLLRTMPATGALFLAYESTKKIFQNDK